MRTVTRRMTEAIRSKAKTGVPVKRKTTTTRTRMATLTWRAVTKTTMMRRRYYT